MRTPKIISILLPPDMAKEIQKVAQDEERSVSNVLRKALRQYLASKNFNTVKKKVIRTTKKRTLKLKT